MATSTTRLGLTKPDSTDLVDIAVLNTNANKIDAAVGAFVCTSTTRPSTPFSGQVIYETDTDQSFVWDSGTSTWNVLVPGATVCTSSSRPAAPVAGQTIYETDTDLMYVYAASVWEPVVKDTIVKAIVKTVSPIKVADAAARDAVFTSPAQGDRVFRTDRQCEEVYFAVYNSSTNVSGATTAGWYPAAGQAIFMGNCTRSAASGTVYSMGSASYLFTEQTDTLGWHSTTTNTDRITPNVAGVYRVTASSQTAANVTGNRRIQISRNGAAYAEVTAASSATNSTNGVSAVMVMNGTSDYVTAQTDQSSGTSLTVTAQLSVEFIRPTST